MFTSKSLGITCPADAARKFFSTEIEKGYATVEESDGLAFVRVNRNGFLSAAVFRGKTFAPGNNYSFKSEERMNAWIAETKAAQASCIAYKNQRVAATKAATAAFVQPYVVGDILCSSWGYEQTNVDFYQVVGLKGKRSVVLREICKSVSSATSSMSEYVVPVPNAFCTDAVFDEKTFAPVYDDNGEQVYKDRPAIVKQVSNHGSVNVRDASFGHARKWDGKPEYQSHYA